MGGGGEEIALSINLNYHSHNAWEHFPDTALHIQINHKLVNLMVKNRCCCIALNFIAIQEIVIFIFS